MADQTELEFMREARIDAWAALADHFRRRGWLNAEALLAELQAETRQHAINDIFDYDAPDDAPEGVTEQESPGAGPAETGTGDEHEA